MTKLFAVLFLLPGLAIGQSMISSVKDAGAICDSKTDDTAAFQRAMNAGNFYIPEGAVCYVASSVSGVSNRLVRGPGVIHRKTAYGNDNIAVFVLDGVRNFTVDGVTFKSDGLNDREAAVFLRDTINPTADITVKASRFENIKGITTWDGSNAPGGLFPAHAAASGYPSAYYETDSHLHRRITFIDNVLVNLTAKPDPNGFAVYLYYCRDVLVARNRIKDLFGIAYLRGGDPNNPRWTANRQTASNQIVRNNTADVNDNGVILIGVRNALVEGNKITAALTSGEILDSEGGRDNIFRGNTINGGQTPFNTFFTNKNIVFEGNSVKAMAFRGGAAGNGIYRGATSDNDPDLANSGTITLRNNTIASTVGEANVFVGWGNKFVLENNQLTNVTLYSGSGTNVLIVNKNRFDFTISPTLKPIIYAAAANQAKWNPSTEATVPRIEIRDNVISGQTGGVRADGIVVGAFTQPGVVEIVGNRVDNSGGRAFRLLSGEGVARTILVEKNTFRNDANTAPFFADPPIARDALTWRDNVKPNGQDTMSEIAGPSVSPLTVDAKAITTSQSRIWKGILGVSQTGWVFDLSGIWRPFSN